MHRDAADILAVIVGNRDGFAVLPFLGIYAFFPGKIFFPVFIAWKVHGVSHTTFPVNTHRHTRRPAGGYAVTAAATAPLKRTNNVDTRLVIHAEVVNSPFGVVDGVNGSTATASSGPSSRLRTTG